jgi:hypothetical protein
MTEQFIVKAKLKHGDKYDYSKVKYINAKEKVIIICKEHGEFLQNPDNHLRYECKKCSIIKTVNKCRSNNEQFIEKAKLKHGDKYDYSKVEYNNNSTKVIIICKIHGEFLQTPNGHFNGGCAKCAGCCKNTSDEFIEKATQIHGDNYDYSKVEYIGAKIKIIIICKEHGDFLQTPTNHLAGNECNKCSKVHKYTLDEWIKKAKDIFGDKFDYTKSQYKTAKTNIVILCKKCNYTFETTPYSFLIQKYGCKKCCGNYEYSNDEWINKAQSMFGDLYDYSKVDYKKSSIKVIIICKKCNNEFNQTPNSHLAGHGCCKCNGTYNYSNDEWKEKAIQLYGKKYNYDNTQYINSNIKVNITCHEHGEFLQKAASHLAGFEGCNKCWKIKQHSKQQILWLELISKLNNIKINHAENEGEFIIPNTRYRADGYCPETNTIYEFHGDYWHGNPNKFKCDEYNKTTNCNFGELYQKTLEKEKKIKLLGYNLVTIWESDWKKINKCIKVLQNKFRNYLLSV